MVDTVEILPLDEQQLALRGSGNGGKVAFDDRGNAVWQFAPHTDGSPVEDDSPFRGLHHPGLAIVDDALPGPPILRTNKKGLRVGYNPYDSGQLARKPPRKPRDIRELSKWIELRKKLGPASQ